MTKLTCNQAILLLEIYRDMSFGRNSTYQEDLLILQTAGLVDHDGTGLTTVGHDRVMRMLHDEARVPTNRRIPEPYRGRIKELKRMMLTTSGQARAEAIMKATDAPFLVMLMDDILFSEDFAALQKEVEAELKEKK